MTDVASFPAAAENDQGSPPAPDLVDSARSAVHRPAAHHRGDPRPLGGYGGLLALYGAVGLGLGFLLRSRRNKVRALNLEELLVYGLATEHLSRVIAKDSITAPIRVPFTKFDKATGQGEVKEDVEGEGWRHAVGELITCPFCIAQWVATGLIAGRVVAPTVTTAVVSLSAVTRISDYLQLAYGYVKDQT